MVKICTQCNTRIEHEQFDDFVNEFRLVKTHSGEYFRNICRECENKKARELRAKNYRTYNYRKKKRNTYDEQDYGHIN